MNNRFKRRMQQSDDEDAPPFIYFNVDVVNNTSEPKPFQVQMSATEFLKDASRYCVAIQRADLSGADIPIMIMSPNEYYVTIEDTAGTQVTKPLVYLNRDSKYGLNTVFSYEEISQTINDALTLAMADFGGGAVDVPFVVYSATTNMFAIGMPTEFDERLNPGNTWKLYYNTRLYGLFANYAVEFMGYAGNANYKIICDDGMGVNLSALSGGTNVFAPSNYVWVTQEYPALFNIQQYNSVVFRSTQIGVKNEFIPTTNTSDALVKASTSGIPNSDSMLTDLIVVLNDASGTRGGINYAPSAFRWIAIQRDTIDNIDIQVFIKDRVGNEIPYYIPPYHSGRIKLVFGHKNFISQ